MPRTKPGIFIVLEGLNGCGKSSVARELQKLVSEAGYPSVIYRDPGETVAGEKIREIVKDPQIPLQPWTQALLYTAARFELGIQSLEHLCRGTVVIADRWWPSTYAYQGALGVQKKWIRDLNRDITPAGGTMKPERSFFLDVPPEVALQRSAGITATGIRSGGDRFELKGLPFAHMLRGRYMELVDSNEITRIEVGDLSPAGVAGEIWERFLKRQLRKRRQDARRRRNR